MVRHNQYCRNCRWAHVARSEISSAVNSQWSCGCKSHRRTGDFDRGHADYTRTSCSAYYHSESFECRAVLSYVCFRPVRISSTDQHWNKTDENDQISAQQKDKTEIRFAKKVAWYDKNVLCQVNGNISIHRMTEIRISYRIIARHLIQNKRLCSSDLWLLAKPFKHALRLNLS